ncbi:MAG TPA: hypothetical protein VII15_01690 [Candidatus Cryosericum sp.]
MGVGKEPSRQERARRWTGWNIDHDVPRLVVAHVSEGADCVPVQTCCQVRSRAFRARASARRALADHPEARLAGRDTDGGVSDEPGPTHSISTRPQDGHRSDSHGMTEWQKGQGRYPVGMSPPVPFVR